MVDPSSNTSRIIDKLVDKGWADRQVCPSDRRRADVLITDSGLTLLAGLDEPMSILFQTTMSSLDATQLAALNDGLSQVLDSTDNLIEQQA